jgi:hypothetical protein
MATPPAAKKSTIKEIEEEELPEGEDDEDEDDDEEDDESDDGDDDEEEGEATADEVAEEVVEAVRAAYEDCSAAAADGKKILMDLADGTKWVLTVRSRR